MPGVADCSCGWVSSVKDWKKRSRRALIRHFMFVHHLPEEEAVKLAERRFPR